MRSLPNQTVRFPDAPSFVVGHEMSLQIVGLLLEDPLLSNADIASRFDATPDDPLFLNDLAIARIILAKPDDYFEDGDFQRLAVRQSRNVMVAVGIDVYRRMASRFGEQSADDLDRWMEIVGFLFENPMTVRHVQLAKLMRKIVDAIDDLAGDKPVDSETIIVEYVGEDPDYLLGGSEIDSGLLERLIAGVSDDLSVIDLEDLISSMLGSTDTEDRRNGWDRGQAQDVAQGHNG